MIWVSRPSRVRNPRQSTCFEKYGMNCVTACRQSCTGTSTSDQARNRAPVIYLIAPGTNAVPKDRKLIKQAAGLVLPDFIGLILFHCVRPYSKNALVSRQTHGGKSKSQRNSPRHLFGLCDTIKNFHVTNRIFDIAGRNIMPDAIRQ